MNTLEIVFKSDLDNKTMIAHEGDKVESKFLLAQEHQVVNPSTITNLIFRKGVNSNFPMFCTGYETDGEWYGDRPGDGIWINPFDGKHYERMGDVNTETTPTRTPLVMFVDTDEGAEIRITNSYYTLDGMVDWGIIKYNGQVIGDIQKSDWQEHDGYLYAKLNAGTSFDSVGDIHITVRNGKGERTFMRVGDTDGNPTYMVAMYPKTPEDTSMDEYEDLEGRNSQELFNPAGGDSEFEQ